MSVESIPYSTIAIPGAPVNFNTEDDVAQWLALDMAFAHNIIIRGINSLWINAPRVIPEDVSAFAGYGLTCMMLIHTHHDGEEKILFPRLQAKLDMGHNLEQHHAFQEPLKELEDYLKKVYNSEEKYDAERMRQLVKAAGDPLVNHLKEEIPTISPEKLSVFSNEELREMMNVFEEHLKNIGGFFTLLPFGLTGHDKRDAPAWPPIPGPIKWFAINIGYFVNRSYWKFASFTRTGAPQQYSP